MTVQHCGVSVQHDGRQQAEYRAAPQQQAWAAADITKSNATATSAEIPHSFFITHLLQEHASVGCGFGADEPTAPAFLKPVEA
jgi:arylamine N-acetyltransferase